MTSDLKLIFDNLTQDKLQEYVKFSNKVQSSCFISLYCLKLYFEKYNSLPIIGSLPDMASESNHYIELKMLYEKKADLDKFNFINIIEDFVLKNGYLDYLSSIANKEYNIVDIICKNWPHISFLEYEKFEDKLCSTFELELFEEHHRRNFKWYILTKSSENYFSKYNHYPFFNMDGENLKNFQNEIKLFYESDQTESLNDKISLDELIDLSDKEVLKEFLRNSKLQPAPVISILGSIMSQEAVKLLTLCFRPINNTMIFNGIDTTISVFEIK